MKESKINPQAVYGEPFFSAVDRVGLRRLEAKAPEWASFGNVKILLWGHVGEDDSVLAEEDVQRFKSQCRETKNSKYLLFRQFSQSLTGMAFR